MFHTYILECGDRSYYVGHTDNLEARYAAHRAGEGCEYTSQRLPVKLVYSQGFGSRDEAFRAEKQIQGWSRKKKEALINGDWKLLQALSKGSGRTNRSAAPSTSSG